MIVQISDLTLAAVRAESIRAHLKHQHEGSCFSRSLSNERKLAILVEEVGEVAHSLTYDGDSSELVKELIQVANVALTWVESLEGNSVE